MAIKRRMFLGTAGLGVVAAAAAPPRGSEAEYGEYERVRPTVSVGLGKGEAASMTLVWLPSQGREQAPPVKARLVLFDIAGQKLAEKQVVIPAFSGAALDYEPPSGIKRQQVFAYGYVDGYAGELIQEIFAGLEVYDVSSGRTNIFAAPIGLA
jgi:hypothetical protein